MNGEITCSYCRHWDLGHVQQIGFDEDAVPMREYYARCSNPKSPCEGHHMEAGEDCEAFEQRKRRGWMPNPSTLLGRLLCWLEFHDFYVTGKSIGRSEGTVETVECRRCRLTTTRKHAG